MYFINYGSLSKSNEIIEYITVYYIQKPYCNILKSYYNQIRTFLRFRNVTATLKYFCVIM